MARPVRRMPPKKSNAFFDLDTADIPNITLQPVGMEDGRVNTGVARVLEQVVMSSDKTDDGKHEVTVLFAIRRPGCGLCREHGIQLSELIEDKPYVNAVGVLKETGVNDAALQDFYTKYFTFPLYKDDKWDLYTQVLEGEGKLTLWKMIRAAPRMMIRTRRKGISNVVGGGEEYTKGGILIFDKNGKLRFVYYERFGDELDTKALEWAIEEARKP